MIAVEREYSVGFWLDGLIRPGDQNGFGGHNAC